ncbi:MAG TPA: hypothetical protein VLC09_09255 [Polyangiaceae bacterium]|nr:hypothetical protein [Polyangiaceae bacterium]
MSFGIALGRSLGPSLGRLARVTCFAAALLGCGPEKVQVSEGPRSYAPDDYSAVQRRWTRDSRLNTLAAMDNVLTVTSTYESWDFRHAWVSRYAEDYRLSAAERRSMLDRSLAEARAGETFYVALFAQNQKYGDLKIDDPTWIVRLVDDSGNETPPLNVERIRKPTAVELTYFPYTSPWRLVYRITFPRQNARGTSIVRPDARWFGLRFAGPLGNTTLVWEVER